MSSSIPSPARRGVHSGAATWRRTLGIGGTVGLLLALAATPAAASGRPSPDGVQPAGAGELPSPELTVDPFVTPEVYLEACVHNVKPESTVTFILWVDGGGSTGAEAVADVDGTACGELLVPPEEPAGEHQAGAFIVRADGTDDLLYATTTVLRSPVTVDRVWIATGETFRACGTGMMPGTTVGFHLFAYPTGDDVATAEATVDADGRVCATIRIPADAPAGDYVVLMAGANDHDIAVQETVTVVLGMPSSDAALDQLVKTPARAGVVLIPMVTTGLLTFLAVLARGRRRGPRR